jgi:hypothetical protein
MLRLYVDDFSQDDDGSKSRPQYYTLQDKINHVYGMLEKCIDFQTDMERTNGLSIDLRPRRQLEGWDFKDLVMGGDPCYLRVATLETVGKGWVDFAREIHAVTLFGRGFGELIQPKDSTSAPCPLWSPVPSGKDYLVARVSDLRSIMANGGNVNSNPRILVGDIQWHVERHTFCQCPCGGNKNAIKHHDPVQALFPRNTQMKRGESALVGLEEHGAVIFTHNMNLHWRWRDQDRIAANEHSTRVTEASAESQGVEPGSRTFSSNNASGSRTSDGTSISEQPQQSNAVVRPLSSRSLRTKVVEVKHQVLRKFSSIKKGKDQPEPAEGNTERQA